MKRRNRLLIGIPLLGVLALVAVVAMRWGLASLDLWKARQLMQQVHTGGLAPEANIDLVQAAFRYLDEAQRFDSNNPDIFDQRGQFLYWQAINTAEAGSARFGLLEQALEQYRASLRLRPMWPYTWANLVVAKAESGVFDKEFRNAVRRTAETGPWEPRVQLQMIRVDFAEQERIDQRSRATIDTLLQGAVKIQPLAVLQIAARWQQLPRVCGLFEDTSLPPQCKDRDGKRRWAVPVAATAGASLDFSDR